MPSAIIFIIICISPKTSYQVPGYILPLIKCYRNSLRAASPPAAHRAACTGLTELFTAVKVLKNGLWAPYLSARFLLRGAGARCGWQTAVTWYNVRAGGSLLQEDRSRTSCVPWSNETTSGVSPEKRNSRAGLRILWDKEKNEQSSASIIGRGHPQAWDTPAA